MSVSASISYNVCKKRGANVFEKDKFKPMTCMASKKN